MDSNNDDGYISISDSFCVGGAKDISLAIGQGSANGSGCAIFGPPGSHGEKGGGFPRDMFTVYLPEQASLRGSQIQALWVFNNLTDVYTSIAFSSCPPACSLCSAKPFKGTCRMNVRMHSSLASPINSHHQPQRP